MLNGNLLEASKISLENPGIIPLPDDDAEAILLLCKILHGDEKMPETVKMETLEAFTMICWKYDIAAVKGCRI